MNTIYRATNKINGYYYVGHDHNWPHRKAAHKSAVKRGSNLIFHNAIRKYGWDNFNWDILEQSEDDLITEREEYWIRKYNSHYLHGNGYNMTYGGEATLGWVPSEETKKKISESNLGKKAWNEGLPSPWTIERNKKNKGIKLPQREKIYEIIDPTGNKFIIKGLTKFCKQNNLHTGNMSSMAHGNLGYYKGWYCKLINTNNTEEK